jgi:hypothetical protein
MTSLQGERSYRCAEEEGEEAPLPCVVGDVAATGTLRSDDVASTGRLCCG